MIDFNSTLLYNDFAEAEMKKIRRDKNKMYWYLGERIRKANKSEVERLICKDRARYKEFHRKGLI